MNQTNVTPFLFEGEHLVRAATLRGEPAIVGKDLCVILGLRDYHQALEKLDPDERGTCVVPTPSGDQEMIVVTEPGAYRLIFASRKPQAERLKRWLAHDVLPAIRKDGHYGNAPAPVNAPISMEARPFPDWSMEEMRTKRSLVDMYRLNYGPMSAQWIAPQLGFPTPPVEFIEHGRQLTLTLTIPQDGA